MGDPDFWRDLAEKFRALPDPDGLLSASWKSENNSLFEWSLRSTKVVWGGISVRAQFEALAARGGAKVDNPNGRDLLSAWLDALNKDLPSDDSGSGGDIVDGKPSFIFGTIRRICETSATFCNILERRAMDAERIAKLESPIGDLDPRIEALVSHANALYEQEIEDFRKERETRYADLMPLGISPAGRAAKREEILLGILRRQIKNRIRIYGKVAVEQSAPEMLDKPLLDRLHEEIMTGVRFARISLSDLNDSDAHAAGQYDSFVSEAIRRRLEMTIEPMILNVVNAEIHVLETNRSLLRQAPEIYPSQINPAQRLLQKAEEQARMQIEYERALARLRESSVTEEVEPVEQLTVESGQSNKDCTRSSEVDDFLKRCNKLSDTTIYKRHIWQSVGHAKGRQFEYWQECNEAKATDADRRNFSRILREGPERFLATLRRKKLTE